MLVIREIDRLRLRKALSARHVIHQRLCLRRGAGRRVGSNCDSPGNSPIKAIPISSVELEARLVAGTR